MQRSLSKEEQPIITLAEEEFGKVKKIKSFFLIQARQFCGHGGIMKKKYG